MPSLVTPYQVNAKAVSANGQTDPIATGSIETLEIDINVTAISAGATISFTYSRLDSYGNAYPVWTGGVSAIGTIVDDIGTGMNVPKSPGSQGVLSWVLSGTTPTATFSAMLQGR